MEATVIEMDCDNDHSEDPADWVTPEKLAEDPDLGDVESHHAEPAQHAPQGKAVGAAPFPLPRHHLKMRERREGSRHQEVAAQEVSVL